jgi:hypothetical protein
MINESINIKKKKNLFGNLLYIQQNLEEIYFF